MWLLSVVLCIKVRVSGGATFEQDRQSRVRRSPRELPPACAADDPGACAAAGCQWQPTLSACRPTKRIVLVGLTGDGKSTTCNWLAGRSDACEVGAGARSKTTRTKSLAPTPLFGDPAKEIVTIVDTPGIADTERRDADQWAATVQELKDLGSIDLILLVVNAQQPRMTQGRQDMLAAFRATFGVDVWKHMALLYTHFPWRVKPEEYWQGHTAEDLSALKADWADFLFTQVEAPDKSWGASAAKLEEEIRALPAFAVDLAPSVAPQPLPLDGVPDPLKVMCGLACVAAEPGCALGLPGLGTELLAREAWQTRGLAPRFGPGQADQDQAWECLLDRECTISVRGRQLSPADKLRLVPADRQCGDDALSDLVEQPEAPASDGDSAARRFLLGRTLAGHGQARACFCEYGKCDAASRFSQDAGTVTFAAASCGPAPELGYARTAHSGDVEYPQRVEYVCESGCTVDGAPQSARAFALTCGLAGQFVAGEGPPAGGCRPVECGLPPHVRHARFSVRRGPLSPGAAAGDPVRIGDEAVYTCLAPEPLDLIQDPYTVRLEGGETTKEWEVACLSTGEFEPGPDRCVRWEYTRWSECDSDCGTGSKTRDVFCSDRRPQKDDETALGRPVGPSQCDEAARPPATAACESYANCEGCVRDSDCMPDSFDLGITSVRKTSVLPVASCLCGPDCYQRQEGQPSIRFRDLGTDPSMNKGLGVHEWCFYDSNAYQCKCALHQGQKGGGTWAILGAGRCFGRGEAEPAGLGGVRVRATQDEYGRQGPQVDYMTCRALCLQMPTCTGIFYGEENNWLPIVGRLSDQAECFLYSVPPADVRAAELPPRLAGAVAKLEVRGFGGAFDVPVSVAEAKLDGYDVTPSIVAEEGDARRGNATTRASLWTRAVASMLYSGHCYKLMRDGGEA